MVLRRHRSYLDEISKQQFTLAGLAPFPLKIRASTEPDAPTDVILRKENRQIIALVNQGWQRSYLHQNSNRIAAHAYWFSKTPDTIQQIIVDISDGNLPTAADYRFSTISKHYTPLPDAHFFRDYGYASTDRFAADHAPDWDDRRDDIVWRGGLNGNGLFSLDPAAVDNIRLIQRLRMALKCQDLDVDFRFIFNTTQAFCNVLRTADLIGDFIPTNDWGGMKYAVDIDGYTNAWCNFIQRLKLGCCVLKVDSPDGYYQWYYHKLTPWEHFVPIRADLGDLTEKIDWVKTNTNQARAIANNGQAFANTMTFESECRAAVQAIEQREKQA